MLIRLKCLCRDKGTLFSVYLQVLRKIIIFASIFTAAMNTIGNIFRFTDFGESHGKAIGGVIDGCPAGLHVDMEAIRRDLERRSGRALPSDVQFAVSPRALQEQDEVEFLSGLTDEGVTLGTPVAFVLRNKQAKTNDYDTLKNVFRPAHADSVYAAKYGIRDYRGGGRASARETAARVVAGAIAKQVLKENGIQVSAQVIQVGNAVAKKDITLLLKNVQAEGDSIGGIVEGEIKGLPVGIGEPLFDKLQARLAYAVMSINACKGFEYGSGFGGVEKKGSELNRISGGALGGISDGTPFRFRCVFKPTPSIRQPQSAFTTEGAPVEISIQGRHDTCIALRAPVIVEAMTALAILDLLMSDSSNRKI